MQCTIRYLGILHIAIAVTAQMQKAKKSRIQNQAFVFESILEEIFSKIFTMPQTP